MKKMQKNEGFTLIELLIVVAIIGIIAAIAVPGLMRARMSGNEASAIGSIRTINSSQATFASSCGGGGYAPDLTTLGTEPTAGGPTFIPSDLVDAEEGGTAPKSGYVFLVSDDSTPMVLDSDDTCNEAADSHTGFFAYSDPADPGTTGSRYFGSDHSGMIRQGNDVIRAIGDGTPLN